MSRCIVFDRSTADAVRARTGLPAEIHSDTGNSRSILAAAVQSRAAVAVLPAPSSNRVVVMRFTRQQRPPMPPPQPDTRLAPAGFLGLSDSIDMDSEPEQPKKWWQKILD